MRWKSVQNMFGVCVGDEGGAKTVRWKKGYVSEMNICVYYMNSIENYIENLYRV